MFRTLSLQENINNYLLCLISVRLAKIRNKTRKMTPNEGTDVG